MHATPSHVRVEHTVDTSRHDEQAESDRQLGLPQDPLHVHRGVARLFRIAVVFVNVSLELVVAVAMCLLVCRFCLKQKKSGRSCCVGVSSIE